MPIDEEVNFSYIFLLLSVYRCIGFESGLFMYQSIHLLSSSYMK